MSGFWWFLLGFACAAALALGWHFGRIRPRMRALAQLAEDRLQAGVDRLRGTF